MEIAVESVIEIAINVAKVLNNRGQFARTTCDFHSNFKYFYFF